jgi:hypothetical protein
MGLEHTDRDESPPQTVIPIPPALENLLLLFFNFKSRFSGFWSPMPRSERDSEDSTGVLKSDFVTRRGDFRRTLRARVL